MAECLYRYYCGTGGWLIVSAGFLVVFLVSLFVCFHSSEYCNNLHLASYLPFKFLQFLYLHGEIRGGGDDVGQESTSFMT